MSTDIEINSEALSALSISDLQSLAEYIKEEPVDGIWREGVFYRDVTVRENMVQILQSELNKRFNNLFTV